MWIPTKVQEKGRTPNSAPLMQSLALGKSKFGNKFLKTMYFAEF